MLGALGSFMANMLIWNNAEDLSKAYLKGGEYVPNLNMTGINPITKKIFGKSASDFLTEKGVKATFKGIASKGITSAIFRGAASFAFNWLFNPYLAPLKIAYDGFREAVRDENNIQKRNTLGISTDESSLYMIDERSNMIRNNMIQSSNFQQQQINQLLNTPNMSANMMNEILGKL